MADKILRFAIPLALTSILQQLFNSADLAVVGRFDSSEAMAAVGSNAALIGLLISLFTGLSLGANVLVASLIGKGKTNRISDAVHTVMTLALISGIILLLAGQILAPQILLWIRTPDSVRLLAARYLRLYFCAMPFIMIYDFGSAVLRSKGDSSRPLYALIAAGILNVGLNLVFVIGFHMGVTGVGTATMISNGLSAGMIVFFLMKDGDPYRIHPERLGIRMGFLKEIIRVGGPAGLQGIVFCLSNVIIQSAINSFGPACIAGNTAGLNFEYISYYVIAGFAQTAVTFTSQNFAAGNKKRCKKVYIECMLLGMAFCFAVSNIFWFGRSTLIGFFTTDPEVIHYAYIRLFYIMYFELMTGTYEIAGGCMRGMGRSLTPAVITMLGCCGIRVVWLFTVFKANPAIETLMTVYIFTWIVSGTAVTAAYFLTRRKLFRALPD